MVMADYDELMLLVEVTGLRQQGMMRTSHATFKIPYRLLARILQLIRLRGGKIVRIHSLASSPPTKTGDRPSPLKVESRVLKRPQLAGLVRRLLGKT